MLLAAQPEGNSKKIRYHKELSFEISIYITIEIVSLAVNQQFMLLSCFAFLVARVVLQSLRIRFKESPYKDSPPKKGVSPVLGFFRKAVSLTSHNNL